MRRSWQGKRRWLDVSDFRRRRSLVPRSNSKAVGDDQTGGLALSPQRTVFSDGNRWAIGTGQWSLLWPSLASHPSAQRREGRPDPT